MTSKPELFARVEHTFSQLTPSEKRVAGWLLAHAAQIPFETADGIAKATGTSGITVGRYLRKLGFRNLEDAKASLRELPVIPYQPWGMNERLDSGTSSNVCRTGHSSRCCWKLTPLPMFISWRKTRHFYALRNSWHTPRPCISSAFSQPAELPTPFSAIWNTCDPKSVTPRACPEAGLSH